MAIGGQQAREYSVGDDLNSVGDDLNTDKDGTLKAVDGHGGLFHTGIHWPKYAPE